MSGEKSLDALRRDIAACRICRDSPQKGKPLPHEPRPVAVLSTTARVCIAGQAPGIRVHDSGVPFNDPSGDRLRQWMGVTRDAFYNPGNFAIVPMGFCFPGYDAKGGDLPPRRECAPAWRARVFAAMPHVELILCIGQYAQAWHLGEGRGKNLTQAVSEWRQILESTKNPQILPLPRPSWRNSGWLKRNPWFEAELVPVLQKRIGRMIA